MGGPSPRLSANKKRPASNADFYNGDVEGTSGRPEQGEDAAARSPKRLKGLDSSKEAEDSAPLLPGVEPSGARSPTAAPAKAHSGWNQGINGGLRTSFAASSKEKFRKPPRQRAPESPGRPPAEPANASDLATSREPPKDPPKEDEHLQDTEPEQQSDKPEKQNMEPEQHIDDSASTGSKEAASNGNQEANEWMIPPPQPASAFEISHKNQRGWEEIFVAWCRSLAKLNEGKIKASTPRERNRVADAYLRWVGGIDGVSRMKASTARREALQYAQNNSAYLASIFSAAPPPSEPPAVGSAPLPQGNSTPSPVTPVSNGLDDVSVSQLEGEDTAYRERYFPGIGLDETFCAMCASHGHATVECPQMTCRFCHVRGHRSFSCPTRLRCTKCMQLGHAKKDCREKLKLASGEMECAFCQSHDHVDASCHELWRSFVFNPDTVRKVQSIPMFCYCCGHQGHYGPACGLNRQNPKESPWETWSKANHDRYIDPASSEVAVVFRGPTVPQPGYDRPDLGKSIVPRRHVFFEEDSDDESEGEVFSRYRVASRRGRS
ncbi:uncharacterized protein B0T15DRAFT_133196 [Chaetomium strumarium]|uniref:CCHC-type domain-containing protein n=1 Tax=Chaetomium strumarium TaxID=1170767 RepID=A0AAJ0M4W9_9PEZI|nr:hypothetical protein B0T15DRAFT_133196 [Chaetomium strumarium]